MNSAAIKISNTFCFLKRYGLQHFAIECFIRLHDSFSDWRFNVSTATSIKLFDMGIFVSNANKDYVPISYSAIFSMLKRIPLEPYDISFLDYGSGKGRVLTVAASKPFCSVTGVEFAEKLFFISKTNISSMRNKKAKSINLHHIDAIEF